MAVSSDGTEEVLRGRFGDGGSLVFRDFAHWVFLSGETCEFFENRRKNNSTGGFYTRPGAFCKQLQKGSSKTPCTTLMWVHNHKFT